LAVFIAFFFTLKAKLQVLKFEFGQIKDSDDLFLYQQQNAK